MHRTHTVVAGVRPHLYYGCCALSLLLPLHARAQPEPAGTPAASPGRVSTASEQSTQPGVDDPQLVPLPPAPRVIHSWREAIDLLRRQTPQYQKQLESVVRARTQIRSALAAVLPSLRAEGSYAHQFLTDEVAFGNQSFPTPVPNVYGGNATLSWPVAEPRSYHAISTAQLGADAAERDFAARRRELASGLVEALLTTQLTARAAELQRQGLRSALEREQLTRAKFRYGQGTTLDIDRASQDVAAARTAIVTADEAARRAREALGLLLGSTTPIAASGGLAQQLFERALAETCRLNGAVEQRADVAAARLRVQLAEHNTTDVWLQFTPSASLASQVAYNSQVSYGPKTTLSTQLVLSVPLYDGGARYARLADAHAAERQARAELAEVRTRALVELSQAQRSSSVAAQTLDIAAHSRELADHVDQSTRSAYRNGIGSSFELVASAQALRQAELAVVQAEFELARARALQDAECQY